MLYVLEHGIVPVIGLSEESFVRRRRERPNTKVKRGSKDEASAELRGGEAPAVDPPAVDQFRHDAEGVAAEPPRRHARGVKTVAHAEARKSDLRIQRIEEVVRVERVELRLCCLV